MKGNVVVTNGRCELKDGCAINDDAGNNMQCKNAVIKGALISPMFKRTICKILVLRNQFVQKETEEGEPENSNGKFL